MVSDEGGMYFLPQDLYSCPLVSGLSGACFIPAWTHLSAPRCPPASYLVPPKAHVQSLPELGAPPGLELGGVVQWPPHGLAVS